MKLLFGWVVILILAEQSFATITCIDGPAKLKQYARQKPSGIGPDFQIAAISPVDENALLKANWGSGTIENGIWSYRQNAYASQNQFGDFDVNRGRYLGKSGLFGYIDGRKGDLLKIGRSLDQEIVFEFSADQTLGEQIQTFDLSPSGQLLAIFTQDRSGVSYLNIADLISGKIKSKTTIDARINSTLIFKSEQHLYFTQRSPGFTPNTYTKLFDFDLSTGNSSLVFETNDEGLSKLYLVESNKIVFGGSGFTEYIKIYERSGATWTLKTSIPNRAIFAINETYIAAMNHRYDYAQDRIIRLYDLSGNLKNELNIDMEVEDMVFDLNDSTTLKFMNNEGSLCRIGF